MTETVNPSFETYQAFATAVFESGVHLTKPEKITQQNWDNRIDLFATMAFNEEAYLRDFEENFCNSRSLVQYYLISTEGILVKGLPEYDQSQFSNGVLRDSFQQRRRSVEFRKAKEREKAGLVATFMQGMDDGESFDEVFQRITKDKPMSIEGVRNRLRSLDYKVPDPEPGSIQKRRIELIDPKVTFQEIKKYFSEMTISQFKKLSKGPNPTLVSFMYTLRNMGIPVNPRSTHAMKFVEGELLTKEIVVGEIPLMIKQSDGTYQQAGIYHYHRALDTERIEQEKEFIEACLESYTQQ